MSVAVSVRVTSINLQLDPFVSEKAKSTPTTEVYFSIVTAGDSIESLNIPVPAKLHGPTLSLRFNSLAYELRADSSSGTIKFLLHEYVKPNPPPSRDAPPRTLWAEAAIPLGEQTGRVNGTTVEFSPTSRVQGLVSVDLEFRNQSPDISPSFSKRPVNLQQMQQGSPSTPSRNRPYRAKTGSTPPPQKREREKINTSVNSSKKAFKFWGANSRKRKNRKFGVRLDTTGPCEVPEILLQTVPCLERRALKLQGIFRESAPASEVESYVKRFEAGKDIAWEQVDNQHIVAGVLMSYLLQMPEPLIPFDLYDGFIAAEETVPVRDERAIFVNKLLKTLPPINREVLLYLLKYLNRLSQFSDTNKMTAHNLGIVFGPALLRKEVEDIKQMVADSPLVVNSVKLLVEEYSFFFANGELLGESAFAEKVIMEELGSATQEAIKLSSDPPLFMSLLESAQDFANFQERLASLNQLVERNIDLTISDLERPDNFSATDVQLLSTLVHAFHSLMDDPKAAEESLRVEVLPSSVASNVTTQCRTLRSAFRSVLSRMAHLQSSVDSTAFESQSSFIEANIVWMRTLQRMKEVFDATHSSLLSGKGSDVDQHLTTIRQVIKTISDTIRDTCLEDMRADLEKQDSLAGAVALARVARVVIQALTEESLDHLSTPIRRPPVNHGAVVTPADRQRIDAICEVMEHAFSEINRIVTNIQYRVDSILTVLDSRPLVQLLVGVKKFIVSFLTSTPTQGTITPSQLQRTVSPMTIPGAADSLASLRLEVIDQFNNFRSLLNSTLMELQMANTYQAASSLALLAEKCRMEANMSLDPDDRKNSRNRMTLDRRQSMGRVALIKSMCEEAFADLREFMFQSKEVITTTQERNDLLELLKNLKTLNQILGEHKSSAK